MNLREIQGRKRDEARLFSLASSRYQGDRHTAIQTQRKNSCYVT